VSALTFDLTGELVERIASRAADLLAERQSEGPTDGWLRGANKISAYLDCPRSRIYALARVQQIPIHRDGTALIARRSELDAWVRSGGGLRP
jgi:hypothetical protein